MRSLMTPTSFESIFLSMFASAIAEYSPFLIRAFTMSTSFESRTRSALAFPNTISTPDAGSKESAMTVAVVSGSSPPGVSPPGSSSVVFGVFTSSEFPPPFITANAAAAATATSATASTAIITFLFILSPRQSSYPSSESSSAVSSHS